MTQKKWCQSEICIVVNDKSPGIIAKHLRCDVLLYYTHLLLAKLQAKWLIVSCAQFTCIFALKDADLAR